MHYLKIHLLVDSPLSLDEVKEALSADLSLSLDSACHVVNILHDRELAAAFVQEQSARTAPEVLTPLVPSLAEDVAAVLERFNLTLPRLKKGEPEWRCPKGQCYGEIRGLHTLRGELVVTNGILGILIVGYSHNFKCSRWAQIHYDNFIPDDLSTLPSDLPPPSRKVRQVKEVEAFADFEA